MQSPAPPLTTKPATPLAFGKAPSILEPVSSSIEWRLGNTTPQGFVRIKQNMSQRVWGSDGEDVEGDIWT